MQPIKKFMNAATSVVMIKPVDFCFNAQTAKDNEFMSSEIDNQTANQKANKEFQNALEKVKSAGVNVVEFDKSKYSELKNVNIPDAVFPNNWFSTDINNSITLYPMLAENRTAEKQQFIYLAEQLTSKYYVDKITNEILGNQVLEGTGSIIVDRVKQRSYCNISQRAEEGIFNQWAKARGYEPITFECFSKTGTPYYHTNVVLSIGVEFAVFCAECVTDEKRRQEVVDLLSEDREVILITRDQVENYFCGNILELQSTEDGSKQIFMSEKAYQGFTDEQKATLEKYGTLNYVNLETIEKVGGGSMRCMLAEVFLKEKN